MISRVCLISTAVFVACAVFVSCHLQGFRVFDHSMWGIHSIESGICSPPELLIFFGGVFLGFLAGVVALTSSILWLVERFLRILHRSRSA